MCYIHCGVLRDRLLLGLQLLLDLLLLLLCDLRDNWDRLDRRGWCKPDL